MSLLLLILFVFLYHSLCLADDRERDTYDNLADLVCRNPYLIVFSLLFLRLCVIHQDFEAKEISWIFFCVFLAVRYA